MDFKHRGLARLNPRTRSVKTYDISDGLPSNVFKAARVPLGNRAKCT
jgi:hypothetical protein